MLTRVIYFYILLFFTINVIHVRSSCHCDQSDPDFANGVNLIYYKCNDEIRGAITFPITTPQELLEKLEDKHTIFYIFGYLQFPESRNVQMMIKALCYNGTDNVVLLDWSRYSRSDYISAVQSVEKVGNFFAQSLQLLVNGGLNVSDIYIIGFSLGAHIAGFAGKCNDFVIPRITGLDPANVSIDRCLCYLRPNDAAWVDIIHTDAGRLGLSAAIGSADYYVNGGVAPQPGCRFDVCSHDRSVELYAESKLDPTKFIAIECDNYHNYILNRCANNLRTGFGYAASDVRGIFYLNT